MAYLAKSREKTTKLTLILLAIVTLVSGVIWLICQFAVGSEKLGFPAILSLFFTLFLTYGAVFIYDAIAKKSVATSMLAVIFLTLGLIFVLIACKVLWWVILIISVLVVITALLIVMATRTKDTAIKFDNSENSGYKTYHERKAQENKSEEEKELPQIKTFKD